MKINLISILSDSDRIEIQVVFQGWSPHLAPLGVPGLGSYRQGLPVKLSGGATRPLVTPNLTADAEEDERGLPRRKAATNIDTTTAEEDVKDFDVPGKKSDRV